MSSHNSASLNEAERVIKDLRSENAKLCKDLKETKSLYSQLVLESERESFNVRRVLLLKSQLIQMERQMLLLSEALSSRATVQQEIENSLLNMLTLCRSYIAVESKSPDLLIPRSQLMKLVEDAESTRMKLAKSIEMNTAENLAKPLTFMNKFVKDGENTDVTLFDICSGKLEHLNLRHVSKLESELCDLYQSLIPVQNVLSHQLRETELATKPSIGSFSVKPMAMTERQVIVLQSTLDKLRTTCDDLLNLSVLVPAAPLPAFRPKIKDLTVENILTSLPTSVKNKPNTKKVLDAVMKSVNLTIHMKTLEINALRDEIHFHQTIYDLQCKHVYNLFDAMKTGYGQFESSTVNSLITPLNSIFSKYDVLKTDASEDALRDFLSTFKSHAECLKLSIDSFKPQEHDVISLFAEDFFNELMTLQDACSKQRDDFVSQLDTVKKQREENAELLDLLLKKPETVKTESAVRQEEYDHIINTTTDNAKDTPQKDLKKVMNRNLSKSKFELKKKLSHLECDACEKVDDKYSDYVNRENVDIRNKEPPSSSSPSTVQYDSIPRTPTSITGSSFPRTSSDSHLRTPGTPASGIPSASKSRSGSQSRIARSGSLPMRSLNLKK